jgi:hypothetical protein
VNLIAANVDAYIEGDGATGISVGSITILADDTSTINAITGAATLAAGFGGTGVAVAMGISIAYNDISNDVSAYIAEANNSVSTDTEAISITAEESAEIFSVTTAASLSVAFGGTGVAVSGAGAAAVNTITNRTKAFVENSILSTLSTPLTTDTAGDVIISATNTSTIDATVAAVAASVAAGGTGVGVAIGAAFAGNTIGYDPLLGNAQVRAYVEDSTITAAGDVLLTAEAEETITSRVFAGAVAIAAGGVGVGVGGSGVVAINMMATDINAFITSSSVTGNSVVLTADDTSEIMAYGGAAAITGGFGGTGVAVSIGVALAHNMIDNTVAAFVDENSTVTSTGGNIELHAWENTLINSVSAAASLAVGIGGVGVSVAGAGAQASNVILTKTNAYVTDSILDSAADVVVEAKSLSAAPDDDVLTVAKGDTFADDLDNASSTDVDKESTTNINERDEDIINDQNFLKNTLAPLLPIEGLVDEDRLAITLREEGKQWSVTDRDTGYTYTLTRVDDTTFSVSMSSIGATVISAAAAISGGGVGVGVSIGVSFATNLIGFELGLDDALYNPDYTTADELEANLVKGKRVKVLDGVKEGHIYEYKGPDTIIYDYTTAEQGSPTINKGDLVKINAGYEDEKGSEKSII